MTPSYLIAFASVAVVLVGALATSIQLLITRPSRRIVLDVLPPTPLLSSATPEMDITYRGQLLREPFLVEFSIHNNGRHDISSDMFDQGRPITIEFNTPVLALVSSSTRPQSRSLDAVVDDNKLLIYPQLIFSGESAKFAVLTAGVPDVNLTASLIDVTVTRIENERESARKFFFDRNVFVLIVGAIIAIAASLIVAFVGR